MVRLFLSDLILNWHVSDSGTMVCLWEATVDGHKTAYIAKSVRFYESGRKVLIFVLESGEM